jgi:nucleotide-binding universal stress UspA family protein
VPVTNTEASDRWFTGGLEGVLPGAYRIAGTLAGGRLQHELDRLREAGVEADGEVVDPMPVDAIRKIASREDADEVIVSTLPRRLSRWMAMDPPHRIRRVTSLPVTHITGPAGPSL